MAAPDDRIAIARSVTISIVTIIFVILGLASSVTNYIIRPQTDALIEQIVELRAEVATLKRSNAAHFGQIKSALKQ